MEEMVRDGGAAREKERNGVTASTRSAPASHWRSSHWVPKIFLPPPAARHEGKGKGKGKGKGQGQGQVGYVSLPNVPKKFTRPFPPASYPDSRVLCAIVAPTSNARLNGQGRFPAHL